MKKREIETLKKIINGEIDSMEGFSELIPNIEELINSYKNKISSERDLIYILCEEVSKKFEKDDLSKFKMNKYFAYGLIKDFISSERPLLLQDEAFDLLQSMESVEMIDKILNDETLTIAPELRTNIMAQRDKLLTHNIYDKNGNEIGTIRFLDDEIKALRAYVGEDVGYSFYPDNDCLYMILNAFLKGGNTLGEESAGWQHKKAMRAILENPEEFLTFALNLSDALHKYSKTINESIYISRSESNAEYIIGVQKTMSFFSATRGQEELDKFRRESTDSIYAIVTHGIDAIDIGDVLKGDYSKPEEKEVLIAPFIPFKYKTIKEHEYKSQDEVISFERTVGTYELEFKTEATSKELSDDEKRDYEKSMEVFQDTNLRKKCIEIWTNLHGKNKEPYFRWREAFSKLFSYKQRERALAIDREITNGIKTTIEPLNLIGSAIEATKGSTRTGRINEQVQTIRSIEQAKKQQESDIDENETNEAK